MEGVEDNAYGDVVDHVVDDAREDSKEDGKVEDNESYSDQYRTEILERHVTRIDRLKYTVFQRHEGYGNHKSKLCQSIGKLTINIISGIFVSIAAMVIWSVVGTYFYSTPTTTTTTTTTSSTINTTSTSANNFQ